MDTKKLIWWFVVGGALLILGGLAFGSNGMAAFGTLIIAAGVVVGVKSAATLTKEEVTQSWQQLIAEGAGKSERIFQESSEYIKASKAPHLKLERRKVAPGILQGITGELRDALVVTQTFNSRLAPYQTFIFAHDYGNGLYVDWSATYRPSFWQVVTSLMMTKANVPNPLTELDLFSAQDLKCYNSIVHSAVTQAVESLMRSMEQDVSKLNTSSQGVLGIG